MPFGVFVNSKSSNLLDKGARKDVTLGLYEWRKDALNVTKETGRIDIMKDTPIRVRFSIL